MQFWRTKRIDHRQTGKSPDRLASFSPGLSLVRRDEGSCSSDIDGADCPRKPRETEGRRELYTRKDDGWVGSRYQAGTRVAGIDILVLRADRMDLHGDLVPTPRVHRICKDTRTTFRWNDAFHVHGQTLLWAVQDWPSSASAATRIFGGACSKTDRLIFDFEIYAD